MLAKLKSSVAEVIKFVLITLAIVLPVRTFIAQPFIVSGASMYPTFNNREYLIIDELSYYFRPPARGEVVVFRYPNDPSKYFIKRIIGLPGETIKIQGNEVLIKTSAASEFQKLTEPYLAGGFSADIEQALGPDEYFVMGDHRQVSLDSRAWGPLPARLITGRALLRLFPPQKISFLPGTFQSEPYQTKN